MKKINKIRILLRQEKLLRKRLRSKAKIKQINLQRFERIKSSVSENISKSDNYFKKINLKFKLPKEFTLLKNSENTLTFIDDVTNSIDRNQDKIDSVNFNLSDVEKIDIGAIGMLLSKINEISYKNIDIWGNFPNDKACNKFISESGFLDHMRDMKGHKFKHTDGNKNLLVNRGFDKTSNSLVGNEIRKAVEHLTGFPGSYRPVFSMVQEMCANSIEHANETNMNWLFAVYYENEKVIFTMTDIGNGILKTLKRKAMQIISDKIGKDDIEILDRAYDKKYMSITSDQNRNKGLPKIKRISTENYIDNLIVITNNVILHLNDESESRIMRKKFHGTFYYWELTKTCIEKWKNREL